MDAGHYRVGQVVVKLTRAELTMTQGVESARVPIGFEDGGEVVAGFPTVGVGVSGELGRSGLELQLVGAKATEDGQPPETAAVA